MMWTKKHLLILALAMGSISAYGHKGVHQQRQLIIKGHNIPKGRFPYFVSLDYHHDGVVLAGVLIARDVVLTAGHALPKEIENVTARIGTYSLTKDVNPETFEVIQTVRHPGWIEFADAFSQDYALFKLNGTASRNDPLANLNRNADIPATEGEALQVLGLGWTNMTIIPSPADTVQMAELNYMPYAQCRKISDYPHRNIDYANLVDQTMLCATGGPNNERDACGWDSGGPVILAGDDYQSDLVVGLVSWGIGCADPVFPSVYARISAGFDWIEATVCELSDEPPATFHCPKKPKPTEHPAELPTEQPTEHPTERPTERPTEQPTQHPTTIPKEQPIPEVEPPTIKRKQSGHAGLTWVVVVIAVFVGGLWFWAKKPVAPKQLAPDEDWDEEDRAKLKTSGGYGSIEATW